GLGQRAERRGSPPRKAPSAMTSTIHFPRRGPVEERAAPSSRRSGWPVSAPGPRLGQLTGRMPVPLQNGGTEMSRDARLRRKILNGIVRRLDLAGRATKDLAGRAIEELSTPELRQMSDRELEGALSYAIGLRAEGERLWRGVFW